VLPGEHIVLGVFTIAGCATTTFAWLARAIDAE
jgi:hypothetical protein